MSRRDLKRIGYLILSGVLAYVMSELERYLFVPLVGGDAFVPWHEWTTLYLLNLCVVYLVWAHGRNS